MTQIAAALKVIVNSASQAAAAPSHAAPRVAPKSPAVHQPKSEFGKLVDQLR